MQPTQPTSPKFFIYSKTLLFNAAVFLVLIINFVLNNGLITTFVKDPSAQVTITGFLVATFALVNLFLRTKTDQGVTFTKPQ